MRFTIVALSILVLPLFALQIVPTDSAGFEIPTLAHHSQAGHGARNSHATRPSLLAPVTPKLVKRSRSDTFESIEARGIGEEFEKAVATIKGGAEWTKGKIVKVFN